MAAHDNREHELYHKLQRAFRRVRNAAEEDHHECLETELRGVLLLYNSGLGPTERAGVLSANGHKYTREKILEALTGNWPEDELRRRDGARDAHAVDGQDFDEDDQSEHDQDYQDNDEADGFYEDELDPDETNQDSYEADPQQEAVMMMRQAQCIFNTL